jgi:hypothetical protein
MRRAELGASMGGKTVQAKGREDNGGARLDGAIGLPGSTQQ